MSSSNSRDRFTKPFRPDRNRSGENAAPRLHDDSENPDLRLALSGRTDFANGQRFLKRFGEDVCYVQGLGFLVWNGHCWKLDRSKLATRQMAHQTATGIDGEVEALRQEGADRQAIGDLKKWRVASQNSARTDAMIREAKPYLEQDIDKLDTFDFIFNAENTTIDLETPPDHWEPDIEDLFVLARPPYRDDLITLRASAAYDPAADCPQWEKFLIETFPDPEVRAFIQRWMGYVLTGSVEEQSLVIFYGLGANGKSTFLETITYVLGAYVAGLPFASLLHDDRRRGSEASPDIARLRGVRLVVTSEPDLGARFSESTIKQLTGGDRLTARSLNQDFFEFRPTFKLMLSANHRPQIRGQDEGIWRRLLLVPFETVIPAERRDKQLPERLKAEASGILNWMLEGYCLWRTMGLQVPAQVREATQNYRESEDPVGNFLSSETRAAPASSVRASDLYQAYQQWCRDNGEAEFKQKAFGQILTERGFKREKKSVNFYLGIELVRPLDERDSHAGSETDSTASSPKGGRHEA